MTAAPAHIDTEAPADDQVAAELDAAAEFARDIAREAHRLRVRDAAREKVAAERQAGADVPPFDAGLLGELLARPPEPPHRVEGLIPTDAGTLIVAQRKTGKTTLDLNLVRSLILGEPFLDRFDVRPLTGRVGFLNYEVSAAQISRWADQVGVPRDRLYLVNLRGRRNPLAHPEDREALTRQLRAMEVEALFVDPFSRAYTGTSQNDPGEVGAWLAELDRYARGDIGVTDLVLSVHAGWDGERSRGATALEDWADSIITVVKDDENVRYLRAIGRDIDVDEDRLLYDSTSRLLSMTGDGSRKHAAAARQIEDLLPAVIDCVNDNPECSQTRIEENVPGRAHLIRAAAILAAERGLIERVKDGQRWVHSPTRPTPSHPVPDEAPSPRPPVSIGTGTGDEDGERREGDRDGDGASDDPARGAAVEQLRSRLAARRDQPHAQPASTRPTPSPADVAAVVAKRTGDLGLGHLPGRCTECGHYVASQGHALGCPNAGPCDMSDLDHTTDSAEHRCLCLRIAEACDAMDGAA